MSLVGQLKQALASLPLFSSGSEVIVASEAAQRVECELTALDTLACAFVRLGLQADAMACKSSQQLQQIAEKLSARLTYLLEPIAPIEIDAAGCLVQLRSSPPQKDEGRTSYYELLVGRNGQITLSRYERTAGTSRTIVPAHVTREVLLRLVADFSAVAG
jgi:hypothetical protein